MFPEWLFSCGGQETLASTARALPTLEGLCGPEAGYGAGLSVKLMESDQQTVLLLV
jgi:hypothetical protein